MAKSIVKNSLSTVRRPLHSNESTLFQIRTTVFVIKTYPDQARGSMLKKNYFVTSRCTH